MLRAEYAEMRWFCVFTLSNYISVYGWKNFSVDVLFRAFDSTEKRWLAWLSVVDVEIQSSNESKCRQRRFPAHDEHDNDAEQGSGKTEPHRIVLECRSPSLKNVLLLQLFCILKSIHPMSVDI